MHRLVALLALALPLAGCATTQRMSPEQVAAASQATSDWVRPSSVGWEEVPLVDGDMVQAREAGREWWRQLFRQVPVEASCRFGWENDLPDKARINFEFRLESFAPGRLRVADVIVRERTGEAPKFEKCVIRHTDGAKLEGPGLEPGQRLRFRKSSLYMTLKL